MGFKKVGFTYESPLSQTSLGTFSVTIFGFRDTKVWQTFLQTEQQIIYPKFQSSNTENSDILVMEKIKEKYRCPRFCF